MRTQLRRVVAIGIVGLFGATGCASSSTKPAGQHNVLTSAELERVGDVDLYDALEQLRPNFLRSRTSLPGSVSAAPILVYVGTMRMGTDYLRDIFARSVKEVRFLEPQQANARFGGNNSGGALLVVLK